MTTGRLLRKWRSAIARGVAIFELGNWVINCKVVEKLCDPNAKDLITDWRAEADISESQRATFTLAHTFKGKPIERECNIDDLAKHELAHCKADMLFWRLRGMRLADGTGVCDSPQWQEAEEMLCEFLMSLARRGK